MQKQRVKRKMRRKRGGRRTGYRFYGWFCAAALFAGILLAGGRLAEEPIAAQGERTEVAAINSPGVKTPDIALPDMTPSDLNPLAVSVGKWFVESMWRQVVPSGGETYENSGSLRSGGNLRNSDNPRKIENQPQQPDPAYARFKKQQDFYREHEYLAWYGDENSGETQRAGTGAGEAGQWEASQPGENTEPWKNPQPGKNPDPAESSDTMENSAPMAPANITPRQPGIIYPIEKLMDYDYLMKTFYNVHASTRAERGLMDAGKLLETDLTLEKDAKKPQILIYHTHSQETYLEAPEGQTVTGIGTYLAQLLEAKGYRVLHDTTVYDLREGKMDRSRAYNYALDGVNAILQENPSIEVVLDVHRDGVADNVHLVSMVGEKETAQIMFFNGLSQTPEGPIAHLSNPYRQENLAFSLKLKLAAEAAYPGFARKIYLKGLRYNEHLRPRSALIEVGAQTNTYKEALNAMEPLAELLDTVLQGN